MARRLSILFLLISTVLFFAYNQKNKNGDTFVHGLKDASQFQLNHNNSFAESNNSQKILSNKKSISYSAITSKIDFPRNVNKNAIRAQRNFNSVSVDESLLEKPLLLEGSPWKVWIGVSAYPKKNGQPLSKPIAEVNGFYLLENNSSQGDIHNFSLSKPLVVVDKRLDIAGILTGVFSVTLKEGVSEDFLSKTDGIKILNSFPAIRTYYITSSNEVFDLQSFYNALKNEADIENFHPEILSRIYEKN